MQHVCQEQVGWHNRRDIGVLNGVFFFTPVVWRESKPTISGPMKSVAQVRCTLTGTSSPRIPHILDHVFLSV